MSDRHCMWPANPKILSEIFTTEKYLLQKMFADCYSRES